MYPIVVDYIGRFCPTLNAYLLALLLGSTTEKLLKYGINYLYLFII